MQIYYTKLYMSLLLIFFLERTISYKMQSSLIIQCLFFYIISKQILEGNSGKKRCDIKTARIIHITLKLGTLYIFGKLNRLEGEARTKSARSNTSAWVG